MTLSKAKFLIGAAAVLIPLTAHALDFTPYPARILSDPNYLPLAGQFYGYTAYTHTWTDLDTINDLGVQTSTTKVNADAITQYLAYGITDDFVIDTNIRYEPDGSRKIDFANGTSDTYDSQGFSNPTFGATYRILDQASYPVNFDVFASYAPDWIDSKLASATENGSFASGGQAGSVGVAFGQVKHDFSYRASFTTIFQGDRKAIDLSDNDPIMTGSSDNYQWALQTQTRLTPQFGVNAGLTYTLQDGSTVTNDANGVSHGSDPGNVLSLSAGLNYQFVPDTVVGALTYTYDTYSKGINTFAVAADSNVVKNKNDNVFGVRLDYAMP